MANLLSEVETLLSGITNVYIGKLPDKPDNIVCLFNSGGSPRLLDGTFLESPSFQVRIRNVNYSAGYDMCNVVKDSLHGKTTSVILLLEQIGDILDMGKDAQSRQEFSVNFNTIIRR